MALVIPYSAGVVEENSYDLRRRVGQSSALIKIDTVHPGAEVPM